MPPVNDEVALEALERVEAQVKAFSAPLHETMRDDLELLRDYLNNSAPKPSVIAEIKKCLSSGEEVIVPTARIRSIDSAKADAVYSMVDEKADKATVDALKEQVENFKDTINAHEAAMCNLASDTKFRLDKADAHLRALDSHDARLRELEAHVAFLERKREEGGD